ncbi:MAG: hypothetical protein Q7N87_01845 [Candidatus Uhrbacteria bacterium]|nr:hypothetical protein [Candidatus Uhrbacteria bacterium]
MDLELLTLCVNLLHQARQSVRRSGCLSSLTVNPERLPNQFRQFVTRQRLCHALGIDIRTLPDSLCKAFRIVERVWQSFHRPTSVEFVDALDDLKRVLERHQTSVHRSRVA